MATHLIILILYTAAAVLAAVQRAWPITLIAAGLAVQTLTTIPL